MHHWYSRVEQEVQRLLRRNPPRLVLLLSVQVREFVYACRGQTKCRENIGVTSASCARHMRTQIGRTRAAGSERAQQERHLGLYRRPFQKSFQPVASRRFHHRDVGRTTLDNAQGQHARAHGSSFRRLTGFSCGCKRTVLVTLHRTLLILWTAGRDACVNGMPLCVDAARLAAGCSCSLHVGRPLSAERTGPGARASSSSSVWSARYARRVLLVSPSSVLSVSGSVGVSSKRSGESFPSPSPPDGAARARPQHAGAPHMLKSCTSDMCDVRRHRS